MSPVRRFLVLDEADKLLDTNFRLGQFQLRAGLRPKSGIHHMGVSLNVGTPNKSSILIGFSMMNHPFWGTPIFGNTHILSDHYLEIDLFLFYLFLGVDLFTQDF